MRSNCGGSAFCGFFVKENKKRKFATMLKENVKSKRTL